MTLDRAVVRDAIALGLVKIALSAWLVHAGFSHISDDDFARTTIAESFAHAPKLDPSGTSWLPFPFWVTGGAMALLGRTLTTARYVAVLLAAVGAAFVYLGARGAGIARWPARVGVLLGLATPWSAWCGAATVPEGFTGAFVAAAFLGLVTPGRLPRWAGPLLLAAALSRYESWPLCLLFAVGAARRRAFGAAAWALIGPLAWVAWNQIAHGSALHFFARVAAYRRAIGADGAAVPEKLLLYPRALVLGAPDVALVAAFAVIAFCMFRAYRARWLPSLAGVVLLIAFLAYGEATDGAPTHHPARALVGAWWILAVAGVDALFFLAKQLAWGRIGREAVAFALGSALVCAWVVRLPSHLRGWPARDAEDDRAPQIARGYALRSAGVHRPKIAPCAYEHFALIAAFGEPENVDVLPSRAPASGGRQPVTHACPRVTTAPAAGVAAPLPP